MWRRDRDSAVVGSMAKRSMAPKTIGDRLRRATTVPRYITAPGAHPQGSLEALEGNVYRKG